MKSGHPLAAAGILPLAAHVNTRRIGGVALARDTVTFAHTAGAIPAVIMPVPAPASTAMSIPVLPPLLRLSGARDDRRIGYRRRDPVGAIT
jgi:hypothetical protein